jgi:phosphatidylethanolamine N-methyltransferase
MDYSSVIMNIDFNNLLVQADKPFFSCVFLSTILSVCCSLIPHLQYKYKIISKITGNDYGISADLFAFVLINVGSARNYSFIESVYYNKGFELSLYMSYFFILIGVSMFFIGLILIVTSFHRLGLRGMYFGDHFGFLFEEKIHTFPYNYFENPQYLGCFFSFLGFSLAFRSMHGLILTLYILICNQIIIFYNEEKKLKVFYPKDVKQTNETQ